MLEDDLQFQSEGDRLFNEGKFNDAEAAYKRINRLFLKQFNLGIMNFSLGDYFSASNYFLRAFEDAVRDENSTARYALGKTQYELGDYRGAKENLEGILTKLSGDVRKDAEGMLKRMKFGVITKLVKGAKDLVLKNPLHSAGAVFAGSFVSLCPFDYNIGFLLEGRSLPISMAVFLASYIGLKTLSKRFTKERKKDAKFDSLLKFSKKEEFSFNDFLIDARKEFKLFLGSANRALASYTVGGLVHSHPLGMTFGLADLVGYYSYKFVKRFKRGDNKKILEELSNYSLPIGAGVWFSLGWLNNLVIKEPDLPLFSIAYLTHLTLKSLGEKDLFKRGLDYTLERINKISLVGGLISAGVFQRLQLEQFNEMLVKIRLPEVDTINFYDPTNLVTLTAVSAFLIKHMLMSIINQEFKIKDRASKLISKPFAHYPITFGLIGGCLGLNYDLTDNLFGFRDTIKQLSETPLRESAHSFLLYSILSSLSATFLGFGLRKIESLSDYVNYFRNKSEGRLKDAIGFYRKIAERTYSLNEKRLKLLRLGELLVLDGDLEDGFNQLREVDKVSSRDNGFFGRIFNYFRIANLSSRDDAGSKRRLALLHSSVGDVKEARKLWKECLSLDDSLMENCLYAEFLTKRRLEGADEQWRKVIEMIAKQPYEIEGLDSTHVVKHIKGEVADYVLKFGGHDELTSEFDLTSRLALAVRNHPEFLIAEPLTILEDNLGSILATRYLKHDRLDLNDVEQLKKVIECMHLIYGLNPKLEKKDVVGFTKERVKNYPILVNDGCVEKFADSILELCESFIDTINVQYTDPYHSNWGVLRERDKAFTFRCDVENKGSWHPFLDLSCLLLFSTCKDNGKLITYFVDGFSRSARNALNSQGQEAYYRLSLLRGIQVIPKLVRIKAENEVETVLSSMDFAFANISDNSDSIVVKTARNNFYNLRDAVLS